MAIPRPVRAALDHSFVVVETMQAPIMLLESSLQRDRYREENESRRGSSNPPSKRLHSAVLVVRMFFRNAGSQKPLRCRFRAHTLQRVPGTASANLHATRSTERPTELSTGGMRAALAVLRPPEVKGAGGSAIRLLADRDELRSRPAVCLQVHFVLENSSNCHFPLRGRYFLRWVFRPI
jgi:hypothetical protein